MDNQRRVPLQDALIDDLAINEGIHNADSRVDDNDKKEQRQKRRVRHSIQQRPLRRARLDLLLNY